MSPPAISTRTLRVEVMRVFKRFQEVGVTVVIASHDPHLVEQFGQREIVLDAGRIASDTFRAGHAARMTAQAPQLSDLPEHHQHMSGAVSSYGTRHLQALFGALGRLTRAPLATMLTLIVIGVALALPAGTGADRQQPARRHRRFQQCGRFQRSFQARHSHRARASKSPRARAMRAGVESVTVTTADAGAGGVQAGVGLRRCADSARRQSAAAPPGRAPRRRTPAVRPRSNRCGAISPRFPKSISCSSISTGCAGCMRCSTC